VTNKLGNEFVVAGLVGTLHLLRIDAIDHKEDRGIRVKILIPKGDLSVRSGVLPRDHLCEHTIALAP